MTAKTSLVSLLNPRSEPEEVDLGQLPVEVISLIFENCNLSELLTLAQVCSPLRKLVQNDIAWMHLYSRIEEDLSVQGFQDAIRNISIIYQVAAERLQTRFTREDFTFEKARELDNQNKQDDSEGQIKSVWVRLKGLSPMIYRIIPDYCELPEKGYKELLKAFYQWIDFHSRLISQETSLKYCVEFNYLNSLEFNKANSPDRDIEYLGLFKRIFDNFGPHLIYTKELIFIRISPETLPDISKFVHLTKLVLSGIPLKTLPGNFVGSHPELEVLDLRSTQLESLPNSVYNLHKLVVLKLGRNNLQKLPDNFGNLKQLKSLDLSNNKFASLPSSLWDLSLLEELLINNNNLEALSSRIGFLRNLTFLSVGSNKLSRLPSSIGDLSNLETLDLRDTPREILPPVFEKLSKLRHLIL